MSVEGVRYAYRLEVDDSAVQLERLESYPRRWPRVLFEREGSDIHFRRGLGTLSGTRELLTPTTLALSAAMRFNQPDVQPFGRELAGVGVFGARRRTPWRTPYTDILGATERMFDDRLTVSEESIGPIAPVRAHDGVVCQISGGSG